jgi:hypothetical protein
VTGEDGLATVTLALLGLPGPTEVRASFAGAGDYMPSNATSPFEILKQDTVLELEPSSAQVQPGQDPGFVATLADVTGRRLGEKTVYFVVNGDGGAQSVARITDYAGRAPLGPLSLPPGSYDVDVYFGGQILLRSGAATFQIDAQDPRYNPASATGSLVVLEPNQPPVCGTAVASVEIVWSPDKSMLPVSVESVTDPDGDPIQVSITGIFQDEPTGHGANSPDGRIVDLNLAEVRAERDGKGDGRVYHIFFTAADDQEGQCQGSVRVAVVPHDQSGEVDVDAIDGGPLYDSTIPE